MDVNSESARFNSQRFNLTHGDTLTKLLQISVPIVATQLLLMSYNLVDMFLLGRLSADAVAASGSAGMYLWLANGIQMIGRMGAEIGVAQCKGCGDRHGAREYSHNSLFLAAAFGFLVAACFILFAEPLIGFLNIREAHVARDAADYLRIVAPGVAAGYVAASVGGSFTGGGNSRAPFIAMAVGLVVNTVLDPIFIFTLGLGVRGAAIATLIAQVIVAAVFIAWLLRKKDRPFKYYPLFVKPIPDRIRQIFRWTIPVAAESLLFTFISMNLARYIADYGSDAIAVFRIGGQAESLTWLICAGFSSGVTAFVGQNYGAGHWMRIRDCFRKAVTAMVLWGVFVSLLFFFLGGQIFHLFVPNDRIAAMGAECLWIVAFCQIFMCLESIAAGAFRGLGRTAPPSIASIVTNATRIPLAALASTTDIGLNGIWWIMSLTAIIRGLWVFVWYLRRKGQ